MYRKCSAISVTPLPTVPDASEAGLPQGVTGEAVSTPPASNLPPLTKVNHSGALPPLLERHHSHCSSLIGPAFSYNPPQSATTSLRQVCHTLHKITLVHSNTFLNGINNCKCLYPVQHDIMGSRDCLICGTCTYRLQGSGIRILQITCTVSRIVHVQWNLR